MKRLLLSALAFFFFAGISYADQAPETERLYLSGKDRVDAVPWEFRCSAGAKAEVWTTIPVPSNWEMHGFGTLSYGSLTPSEKGEYKHNFVVPSSWAGRRISLVFEGVMTDTSAFLNGKSVGSLHQGGFYRFRYDVTELLQLGAENVLDVQVDETSGNAGVNRAERTGDYWNFGGIYRPVWLEAAPMHAISCVAIDARADGGFTLDAFLSSNAPNSKLVARLLAANGSQVGQTLTTSVTGLKTRLQTHFNDVELWSAETPQLYTVELTLVDGDKVLHRMRQRFGFRTFEVRLGSGLFLNGHRIVLQGANRHCLNATSGRCLSEADQVEDLRLIKEMNMNAVRCSHYPPDERFLDLCDEQGLYVLDELSGWQKGYDTTVGRALLGEMLQRDVNHPSILFWDNGNEGGGNTDLDGDFAQWDPQRRTVLHPWGVSGGINTAHYRPFAQAVVLGKGMIIPKNTSAGQPVTPPLIYMPTEFQHGLYDGGAGAGLEDYWILMRASSLLGGGFLWALLDEGVLRPETGKIDVCGNSGPDGILGPRREKEASFYTIKELWSPLVISEQSIPDNFNGVLTLENRYSFTNTAACRFTWELRRMPSPFADATLKAELLASAQTLSPNLAPGEKGRLELKLPLNWTDADVLALRADDPSGRELWTWTWPLPGLSHIQKVPTNNTGLSAVSMSQTERMLVVQAGDLLLSFDKATGFLSQVARDGHGYSLVNGPRPAAGRAELVSIENRVDGGDIVISARYEGTLRKIEWRVRTNGWVDCSFEYTGVKGSPYEGVFFDYPAEKVRAKSWVGNGPYRIWQNRLRGVSLGVWRNAYNDTITGWSGWEYPEFKGCFSGVRWLSLDTTEGTITVIPGGNELYVQVLTPALVPDKLRMKAIAPLPEAGLAFLHVIPAMGDKFHRPEDNGPSGMIPPLQPVYSGKVSLHFGL